MVEELRTVEPSVATVAAAAVEVTLLRPVAGAEAWHFDRAAGEASAVGAVGEDRAPGRDEVVAEELPAWL